MTTRIPRGLIKRLTKLEARRPKADIPTTLTIRLVGPDKTVVREMLVYMGGT